MDTHRKIELQSPLDLHHITANLHTAATQRLNNALPPSPSTPDVPPTPDAYRAKVESLVSTFVAEVLTGLRSNISINGLDVVPASAHDDSDGAAAAAGEADIVEYEAFDEKLRARVAAAAAKRDALISKISTQRRTVPKRAAEHVQAALRKQIEDEDAAWAEAEKRAQVVDEADLVGVEVKRLDEVERNWARAVEGLGRLKGGMGETRARLERAGTVVGYLDVKGA
jgi:kinetochor protein Mis14/NSL1